MIHPAYAQVDIKTNYSLAGVFPDLGKLVGVILFNAYVLAGIIFFLLLLFGGFGVIMGAGGSNPEQTAKGGKTVAAALGGFLIIFLSYWIIRIIEVITGIDIFQSGV